MRTRTLWQELSGSRQDGRTKAHHLDLTVLRLFQLILRIHALRPSPGRPRKQEPRRAHPAKLRQRTRRPRLSATSVENLDTTQETVRRRKWEKKQRWPWLQKSTRSETKRSMNGTSHSSPVTRHACSQSSRFFSIIRRR